MIAKVNASKMGKQVHIEHDRRGYYAVRVFYTIPNREHVIKRLKQMTGAVWKYPEKFWKVDLDQQPNLRKFLIEIGQEF